MRFVRAIVALLFFCALPASARAQVCVGSGSFAASPVHLGIDLTVGEDTSGLHASLGVGGRVPFGGVAIAAVRTESLEATAKALVFFGGVQLGNDRVSLCPMGDIDFTTGPNVGTAEVKGTAYAGGARLGIVAVDGPLRVIPTFGYFHSRQETTTRQGAAEVVATRTFGLVQAGVGFAGRKVAFGPVLVVPLVEGAKAQLRLGVSVMF
jgi:hypothetical protein